MPWHVVNLTFALGGLLLVFFRLLVFPTTQPLDVIGWCMVGTGGSIAVGAVLLTPLSASSSLKIWLLLPLLSLGGVLAVWTSYRLMVNLPESLMEVSVDHGGTMASLRLRRALLGLVAIGGTALSVTTISGTIQWAHRWLWLVSGLAWALVLLATVDMLWVEPIDCTTMAAAVTEQTFERLGVHKYVFPPLPAEECPAGLQWASDSLTQVAEWRCVDAPLTEETLQHTSETHLTHALLSTALVGVLAAWGVWQTHPDHKHHTPITEAFHLHLVLVASGLIGLAIVAIAVLEGTLLHPSAMSAVLMKAEWASPSDLQPPTTAPTTAAPTAALGQGVGDGARFDAPSIPPVLL